MSKIPSAYQLPNSLCNKLKDRNWVVTQLSEGKSGQEIFQFSDATMDQFYKTAVNLYENKQYEKAVNAFLFLGTLNPAHYDYWIGLGAATQRCEDYEGAIDAYEMAAICQLDNPIPYFHLAKCLFAMHDRQSALQAIDLAIEYSQDRVDFDEIYHQAKLAREILIKDS